MRVSYFAERAVIKRIYNSRTYYYIRNEFSFFFCKKRNYKNRDEINRIYIGIRQCYTDGLYFFKKKKIRHKLAGVSHKRNIKQIKRDTYLCNSTRITKRTILYKIITRLTIIIIIRHSRTVLYFFIINVIIFCRRAPERYFVYENKIVCTAYSLTETDVGKLAGTLRIPRRSVYRRFAYAELFNLLGSRPSPPPPPPPPGPENSETLVFESRNAVKKNLSRLWDKKIRASDFIAL